MAWRLVVVDDPVTRALVAAVLRDGGRRVRETGCQNTAVDLVAVYGVPDVAVLDVAVLAPTRFQGFWRLRQMCGHLPVVLLNDHPDPQHVQDPQIPPVPRHVQDACQDHLTRPLQLDQLRAAVHTAALHPAAA